MTGDLLSYSRTFASNKYRRPLASSALTKSAYAFIPDNLLLALRVHVGRATSKLPIQAHGHTRAGIFFLTYKKGFPLGYDLKLTGGEIDTADRKRGLVALFQSTAEGSRGTF